MLCSTAAGTFFRRMYYIYTMSYRSGQLKLDRRLGGRVDLQGKREELSTQKGKGKAAAADEVSGSFPPYYQAARTHARTETEIDFPVGLTPQPSIVYLNHAQKF